MEIGEGGELLKVLHATLGRRPTKFIVWVFAFVAFIFALRYGIEGIDWLMGRFAWEAFSWSLLLNAFVTSILSLLMLVGLGIVGGFIIAIPLRFGIDALQRRKVERLADSLVVLLKEIETDAPREKVSQIQSFISQAEKIRKPPWTFRILDKLFKKKNKQ